MIGSRKLRSLGIAAALVTFFLGYLPPDMINRGAIYSAALPIAFIAFLLWVVCAGVLLVRLCSWLYATRGQRTKFKSIMWIFAILWAPIVVPFIVRVPVADELATPEEKIS